MATQTRARGAAAAPRGVLGLRLLAIMLGVFFLGMSSTKLAWFLDSSILLNKFQMIFLPKAPPVVRWYLETVCIPGAPLFARLVPLGDGRWPFTDCRVLDADGCDGGVADGAELPFRHERVLVDRFSARWNRTACARRAAGACHQRHAPAVQRIALIVRLKRALMHASIDVVGAPAGVHVKARAAPVDAPLQISVLKL